MSVRRSVCLSVCSVEEHTIDLRLIAAITSVYEAQGTDKLNAAAAGGDDAKAAADSGDEQALQSNSEPSSKRRRRGSGGSGGATDRAAESFERAMSKLAPIVFTAERWLSECGITAEQRAGINAEMPGGEPTATLLQTFDDEDFDKIKLTAKQIKAWKTIAAQYKPTS
jgi:hypothetical protein